MSSGVTGFTGPDTSPGTGRPSRVQMMGTCCCSRAARSFSLTPWRDVSIRSMVTGVPGLRPGETDGLVEAHLLAVGGADVIGLFDNGQVQRQGGSGGERPDVVGDAAGAVAGWVGEQQSAGWGRPPSPGDMPPCPPPAPNMPDLRMR